MNTPAAPGDSPGTTSTSNGPAEPSPDDDRTVVLDAPAEAASGEEVTMVLTAEERATLAALASRHASGTGAAEAEQPVAAPVAETDDATDDATGDATVDEPDDEPDDEPVDEPVDVADDAAPDQGSDPVGTDEVAEEAPEAAAADEPVDPTAGTGDPVDPLDPVDPADVTVLIRGGQDADLMAEDRTVMIQGGQYSLDKLGLTPDFAAPAPGQPEPVPPAPPVAEEPAEPEASVATPVEEPAAEEPAAEEPAAEEPAVVAPAGTAAVRPDAAEDTTEVLSSDLDPVGTAVEIEPVAGAADQPGSAIEDVLEAVPAAVAPAEPDGDPESAVTELLAAPTAEPVAVGPGDAPLDQPAEVSASEEPAAEVPDAPAAVTEEPMAAAFAVAPPAATTPPVTTPPVTPPPVTTSPAGPPPVAPPSTGPAPDQESPWAAALRSGTDPGHPDPTGTDLDGTALPDEDLYPDGADPDAGPADVEAALGFTDHEAIAERRRAVRRQRRQTITFLVMFGTVLMMGVAGYTYWTGLWGSANGPIKGAVACPVPTATAAAAKDVSLSVLNGSEKRGLAQTIARQLQARQFSIKTIGNDNSVKPGPEAAVIRFGPSGQLQARTAAAQVAGKVRLLNDKRKDESVDLILQPGFKALNTTKVTQRLLAPPPVKSPEGCVPVG